MRLLHGPRATTARFDDANLIGYAGLVPALRLAQRCGLYRLVGMLVHLPGSVNECGGRDGAGPVEPGQAVFLLRVHPHPVPP